ncbi:Open reading frame protein [Bacillus subtilis]|uniref:Open reading frame protein n=1 Tax=Bacillus subtilis TaxID=1423 RepID=Q45524_BACIU|nr:open reading frame [Bacillus subtilis]CAI6310584.1 Open reading frame protein [Bacillus subtilis]CAI6319933.1 Open reading frame protein [Bacillus subtilis]CAI6320344.1 Open reading frame protein [Bacillus subtilis]CAI6321914.1 Open reading frame protein [Bacillus subtilis]
MIISNLTNLNPVTIIIFPLKKIKT